MRWFIFFIAITIFGAQNDIDINSLSATDKTSMSSKYISEMEDILKSGYSILKKTRKEKDILKLNCVNDNITQMKALIARSKGDSISLKEALSSSDEKSASHHFAKIYLAYQTVQQSNISLVSCTGSIITYAEQKDIEIQVEELLIERDYVEEHKSQFYDISFLDNSPFSASPYF
ncbi:hypothetical protein JXR93_13380 [bacterium]|nr:hypothetical protein [bacterium]